MRITNCLDELNTAGALTAANAAISYAATSLPSSPLDGAQGMDAQALFDWAVGLELRGIVYRHMKKVSNSLQDLDAAERAMAMILVQVPMKENYSAMARILHNRSNTRLQVRDLNGAGEDATRAIKIRRQLAATDPAEADLLAGTLKARSAIFLLGGQKPYALKDAEEAVAIRRAALPLRPDPMQQHVFSMTLYTLAATHEACGHRAPACAAVRDAIAMLTTLKPTPVVQNDLAMCKVLEGRVG